MEKHVIVYIYRNPDEAKEQKSAPSMVVVDVQKEHQLIGQVLDWYTKTYGFDRRQIMGAWIQMVTMPNEPRIDPRTLTLTLVLGALATGLNNIEGLAAVLALDQGAVVQIMNLASQHNWVRLYNLDYMYELTDEGKKELERLRG